MNHPHYVIDWNALDEAIDHCDRFYNSNALAPIENDLADPYDYDERPTGWDFIHYHRAESNLLGTWEPEAPRPVRISRQEFMIIDDTKAVSDHFERFGVIELTTLLDAYDRPIAICLGTRNRRPTYYRIDRR